MDKQERHMVFLNDTMPRFAAPDRLLFSRDGSLYAQRLDLKQFQLAGKPVLLSENVRGIRPEFSASANGVLAYRETANHQGGSELVWYSRQGRRMRSVGERMSYRQVRLSPNERYAALDAWGAKGTEIQLLDLETNVMSRLSFEERMNGDIAWSPDSRRIVYGNHTAKSTIEPSSLWELTLGERAPRKILEEMAWITPDDWSPDGRFLLVRRDNRSIATLPIDPKQKPATLLEVDSKFHIDEAHLSPDGHWLAYQSDESGSLQVYVASFPSMTGKKQISVESGCIPFWRKDGREIFYMSRQGQMMSVAVKPGAGFDALAPAALFQGPSTPLCGFDWYAATGDGQSFLMIDPPPQARVAQEIHVVLHWDSAMPR